MVEELRHQVNEQAYSYVTLGNLWKYDPISNIETVSHDEADNSYLLRLLIHMSMLQPQ